MQPTLHGGDVDREDVAQQAGARGSERQRRRLRIPGRCRDRLREGAFLPPTRRAGRRKLLGRREILPGIGLYLDGGFGVGKTHLLASAYYELPGDGPGGPPDGPAPKAFATFGELTQLAGVFGFAECIDLLDDYTAVCIDEFELDDPGNTTLISRMLSSLVERLVRVVRPEYVPVWLRKPNALLDDDKPLDVIASGEYRRVSRVIAGLETTPVS